MLDGMNSGKTQGNGSVRSITIIYPQDQNNSQMQQEQRGQSQDPYVVQNNTNRGIQSSYRSVRQRSKSSERKRERRSCSALRNQFTESMNIAQMSTTDQADLYDASKSLIRDPSILKLNTSQSQLKLNTDQSHSLI